MEQNSYIQIVMGEKHSKRSTTALFIAIVALLISLVNLYLITDMPGMD